MRNPLALAVLFLACSPVPAPIGTTGPEATSTSAEAPDGTTAPTSTGDATTGPEEASTGTSTGDAACDATGDVCADLVSLCVALALEDQSPNFCEGIGLVCKDGLVVPPAICEGLTEQCVIEPRPAAECAAFAETCACVVGAGTDLCFGDQCDGPCAAGLSCEPHPDNASLAVCAAPCTRAGPCSVEIDGCDVAAGRCREGFDGVLFCFPGTAVCGVTPTECAPSDRGFCADVTALCVEWEIGGASTFCEGIAAFCANGTEPCDLCGHMAEWCGKDGQTPDECATVAGICACLVDALG